MSKTYKIKVNQGAGEAKFVDIPQVGTSGKALSVKAVPGGKYQLMDASTGFAPENIRATRSGKDLQVFFEGRGQADLVIEDYYEVTPEGFNGLIGESESGRFYEYIPESAVGNTAVPLLADGSTQVGMALGGEEINASGAAVGALVAAAGLNPLLLAPLALLGAGGGGGGGATDNKSAIVKIDKAILDTGVSDSDFITQGPVSEISGSLSNFTGTPGDKVKLELLDKDGKPLDPILEGTVTPNALNGVWTWKWTPVDKDTATSLPEVLKDGNYTLKATIVSSTGVPYTHGTASASQALSIDNFADGPNTKALLEILSVTQDTGPSDSDFYTNDQTLVFNGNYAQFTTNGDLIKLELKNETGVVDTHYFNPSDVSTTAKNGVWSWDRTEKDKLPEGQYTLAATVVDRAGNVLNTRVSQDLTIDISGVNEGNGVLSITSMKLDSGVGKSDDPSRKDYKTNDNMPEFQGKLTGSTIDQWVEVRLHNQAHGTDKTQDITSSMMVKAGANTWTWSPQLATGLADAKYDLTAAVVDKAGNTVSDPKGTLIHASQVVVIDTHGLVDPTDPNVGFVISDFKIQEGLDTGLSKGDFITKAGGTATDFLVFEGQLSDGDNTEYNSAVGGGVWVQVLQKDGGTVATEGWAVLNGNGWKFATQAALAEGDYVVKAALLDQVANRLSSSDHLLVIDRTVSPIKAKNVNTVDGPITFYSVGTDEQGQYSVESVLQKNYTGGYFDLTGLQGQTIDKFEIQFSDVAGNTVFVEDTLSIHQFASNAILKHDADAHYPSMLASPGHTTAQPTVVGDVGTLEWKGTSSFDMSSLYDGISYLPQKGAINHVNLLDANGQTLDLSVQDVLALGVESSYLRTDGHAGKVQMRIEGDSMDAVRLTNEPGATVAWVKNESTIVHLEGIAGDYYVASQSQFGLEIFFQVGIQISIV